MRPHERPSQTPSVLRLDVARRKDLSLHDVGLRPRIALVTRRAELKPRPALDRRVGVGALPGKRREAQERATGPVLRDDARSLDGKLVCRDRLGEDQDVALVTGLQCHGARIGAPMLDGLRREFPEVITLARAIPHPRIARGSPFWSVPAAFGAGFFASAVVTILVSLLIRLTSRETPLPTRSSSRASRGRPQRSQSRGLAEGGPPWLVTWESWFSRGFSVSRVSSG